MYNNSLVHYLSLLAGTLASRSSPTPIETGPRVPPEDLPMGSDIGLRSPCDGMLARRRIFRNKQQTSTNSINSDNSNSCDTPTSSQNSPRDLSVVRGGGSSSSASVGRNSDDIAIKEELMGTDLSLPNTPNSVKAFLVKVESADSTDSSSMVTTAGGFTSETMSAAVSKLAAINNQVHHTRSSSLPSSPRDFKYPKALPETLRFKTEPGFDASGLPSHYTPSPLAMPSPNWSAVEKYISNGVLKTPKPLNAEVFDFLGPPPITPRSMLRDNSPGYCSRDQKLSPRLSPRFPIPEAPTDLSKSSSSANTGDSLRASSTRGGNPPPYPSEAEDLSMASKTSAKSSPNPTPPPLPPSSHVNTSALYHIQQQQQQLLQQQQQQLPLNHPGHLQLKQEYPDVHDEPSRSRHSSGIAAPPGEQVMVKREAMETDEYMDTSNAFEPHSSAVGPLTHPRFPPSAQLYLSRFSQMQQQQQQQPPHQQLPPHHAYGSQVPTSSVASRLHANHSPLNQYSVGGYAPLAGAYGNGGSHHLGQPGWPPVPPPEDEESSRSPPMGYHSAYHRQGSPEDHQIPLIAVNPPSISNSVSPVPMEEGPPR